MQKLCPNCQKKFTPKRPHGIFCQEKCRKQYRGQEQRKAELEAAPPISCPTCETEFKPKRSDQKFCSPKCQHRQNRRGRKPTKTTQWWLTRLWGGMSYRTRTRKSYQTIEVLMTKDEFCKWARPLVRNFLKNCPNCSPSVDRIDPKGHYEIPNIRIISATRNSARALFSQAYQEGGEPELVSAIVDVCHTEQINIHLLIEQLTCSQSVQQ